MDNTINNQTAIDPTVELETPDGKEVLQLIYDYHSAQAIAIAIGIHPIFEGMESVMKHPNGYEVALWCLVTKMGKKWDVPEDQRRITRAQIVEWCEDINWLATEASSAIATAWVRGSVSKRKRDEPPAEIGEQSPNATGTTAATT
jgi:hypothetical protein